MDSMVSCTELMKHAEHCGFGCTPTLNHTGELKAIFCSTSRCVSSSRKASRDGIVGEIAAFFAPAHDGVHHAADQLAHRTFALGRAGLAVKIFAGDDIGSRLRPVLGNFHAFLAENRYALFVPDQRGALFPFHRDRKETVAIGEIPLKKQSLRACRRVLSGVMPVSSDLPFSAVFTVAICSST